MQRLKCGETEIRARINVTRTIEKTNFKKIEEKTLLTRNTKKKYWRTLLEVKQ
jgi:hypothetical protein